MRLGIGVCIVSLLLAVTTAEAARPIPGGYYLVRTPQHHLLYGKGGPFSDGPFYRYDRDYLHVSHTGKALVTPSSLVIKIFTRRCVVGDVFPVNLEARISPGGWFRKTSDGLPLAGGQFVTRTRARGIARLTPGLFGFLGLGCQSPWVTWTARYVGQHRGAH